MVCTGFLFVGDGEEVVYLMRENLVLVTRGDEVDGIKCHEDEFRKSGRLRGSTR